MFYIVWAVINFALIVVLLAGFVYIIKRVHERWGSLPAVLLAIVLISSGSKTYQSQQKAPPNSQPALSGPMAYCTITETPMHHYVLTAIFNRDSTTGIIEPGSAAVNISGTTAGQTWTTDGIQLLDSGDHLHFKYQVYGHVNWYLLFFQLYSEPKTFSGIIRVQ